MNVTNRFLALLLLSIPTISAFADYRFITLAGSTTLNSPNSIASDADGNIYVIEPGNDVIRKITSTGTVSAFAGLAGASGSLDGTGTSARFDFPQGITSDAEGNLYVADTGNNAIRKVSPAGVVVTLAGSSGGGGGADPGSTDATGSAASFYLPYGVAVDTVGNVYVADTFNHTIRKITAAGVVTTVAGLAGVSGNVDATGTNARFNKPTGLAVDGIGNVYVADSANHNIRKITSAGVVTTLAGSTSGSFGYLDDVGTNARFTFPHGLALDDAGNIYVADTFNNAIRRITSAGVVTTIGGASMSGNVDGVGANARFNSPDGVVVDSNGTIYVADSGNNLVRKGVLMGVATADGNAVAHGATNFPLGGAAGSVIDFSYTVTNTGTKAWGANHYLGLLRGDGSLVQLASVSGTAMGGSQTVIFSLPTPAVAGTYQYRVQALENGVEWFGNSVTLSLNVSAPVVSAQGNAVAYGANSFPLSVSAGSVVNFTYNVTNAGTKAWGANHYLALLQSDYTVIQLGSLNTTATGGSQTVNFSLPVPASPGTYQYRVQALENGMEWFGSPVTLTLTVTPAVVTAQGNALAYGVNSFPMSASAGSVVEFSYNVSNVGTQAWGSNHYLALLDAGFNLIEFADLSGIVAGGSTTARLSFPVPGTPGTYQYIVRPLENGVEWFGTQLSLTLIVTPAVVTAQGNALGYGTTTFPTTVSSGATVNFTYNTTNLGTRTWGANHYLALLDPNYNLIDFGDLATTTAGGSKAAAVSFTAPVTPGTYHYILRPLENGIEWFGTEVHLTLIVQ